MMGDYRLEPNEAILKPFMIYASDRSTYLAQGKVPLITFGTLSNIYDGAFPII